ncbi:MAG: hypothetical protein OXD31_09900, partial [Chloroflexi bacterium]|nr:hypothetical protein [Chloroflexota bacterium]
DLFQTAEETSVAEAPVIADRRTPTPVGNEQLFFGEVSGFSPPPVGGGDAVVASREQSAPRQAAEGADDDRSQVANPPIVAQYHGPWSPEERITESDTIARGRLRSAYVGAAYSHEQDGERHYRPVVEFIYDVSEYLKGDGSGEIAAAAIFFGNPTSVSQQSALELALSTAERMTNHMSKEIKDGLSCDEPSVEGIRRSGRCLERWEIGDNILYGEEWLVFLTRERPYASVVPTIGRARRSEYAFIGEGRHGSLYATAWMPSVASVSEDDALADEWHFTTGPYAGTPSQSIFALSDVRESIAEIDELFREGEEIADYKHCLSWMYYEKRVADWDAEHYGRTYTADEIAEFSGWVRDEGCAEAMSAVGLFEDPSK